MKCYSWKKPQRWASTLLATTMLGGLPALAQDNASGRLETVTVTATKVGEQDLQKVPVSIQVLDNQRLEDLHIADFRDFARFLPSVSYTAGGQGSSGGPGQGNISMRGVTNGADGNHSGPLPTVGVYLDELSITSTNCPSPRSVAHRISPPTIWSASRCWPARKVHCSAPARKPAPSA